MTHDRMLSCDKIMSKYSPESWSTNVLLSQQDVKWRNPQCKQIMIKYQRNCRPDLESQIRTQATNASQCRIRIGDNMQRLIFQYWQKLFAAASWRRGECPVVTCHRGQSQSSEHRQAPAPSANWPSTESWVRRALRVRDKTEYCSFDAGLWRDSRAKVLRRFRPSAGRVN